MNKITDILGFIAVMGAILCLQLQLWGPAVLAVVIFAASRILPPRYRIYAFIGGAGFAIGLAFGFAYTIIIGLIMALIGGIGLLMEGRK